jgi:DNA repair protein RadC
MFNLISELMEALTQIAEVRLVYSTNVKPSNRQKISSSKDAYGILMRTWDMETIELHEEVKVLLLNNAHRLLGVYSVSKGRVTGAIASKLNYRIRYS